MLEFNSILVAVMRKHEVSKHVFHDSVPEPHPI